MNKADLVKHIAESAEITRAQAAEALGSFTGAVADVLKKGKSLMFVGFGTFKVVERKARTGLNPQTKKKMKIAKKKVIRFVPGKKLKDLVS